MNAPENYEQFVLPEGIGKVSFEKDSKVPNTMIFTIMLEDHTVGNMIKMQLLRDEKVRFAGYRKPHPLEHKIEIRISTNGEITPLESFKNAINSLFMDLELCDNRFRQNLSMFKNTNK